MDVWHITLKEFLINIFILCLFTEKEKFVYWSPPSPPFMALLSMTLLFRGERKYYLVSAPWSPDIWQLHRPRWGFVLLSILILPLDVQGCVRTDSNETRIEAGRPSRGTWQLSRQSKPGSWLTIMSQYIPDSIQWSCKCFESSRVHGLKTSGKSHLVNPLCS